LAVSLDKAMTKMIASANGVRTPAFRRVRSHGELDTLLREVTARGAAGPPGPGRDAGLGVRLPLFVKPNAEGSSMGIRRDSLVDTPERLVRQVTWVLGRYADCLVEAFAPGREFCVGILGTESPRVFPVLELRAEGGFYAYEDKSTHRKELLCPADIPAPLADEMRRMSQEVFRAIGCRDFARVDLKLDAAGDPTFIEINPLPGLSPYYGVYPQQARADGVSHEQLIGAIIASALQRVR
jgi:D-alanine-D-alanine ligase